MTAPDDFLTAQLAAVQPLEFVRFWAPSEGDDGYRLLAEVVHEETAGVYTLTAPGAPAATLEPLGLAEGRARLEGADPSTLAATLRAVLASTTDGPKVSLTHGTRAELARRRRIEAVVAETNRLLSTELIPGGWKDVATPPFSIGVAGRVVELAPVLAFDTVVMQAVVPVAHELPDRPEIAELVATANESLFVGRLVRHEGRIEFRDVVPAEPLTGNALRMLLQVAGTTAQQYAPPFVELGATDAVAVDETPEAPRASYTYL